MKFPTLIAAIGLIGLLSRVSFADEAQQTFDSVYGTRVKHVKATRSGDDDVLLAKQFIEAARGTSDTPSLVVVLCKEAYDLAQRHELTVSLDSMRLLAETSEADRKTANENIVKILTIQTRAGDPAARAAAVDELVRLLTTTGDTAFEANDLRAASAAYRQALLLAARHRHASADTLREKINAVAEQTRLMRQVAQLEETLLRDANDEAALIELAMIYLLDLQTPKEVARLVPRVKDGTLKSTLQLAIYGSSQLNATSSWKLGQWYLDVSKLSKGDRAAIARLKASIAIKRFLLLHPRNDIDRARATLLLKGLEGQLAKDAASGVKLKRSGKTSFRPPNAANIAIRLTLDERGISPRFKDSTDLNFTRTWTIKGTRSIGGKQGNARWFNGAGDVIYLPIKQVPAFNRKRLTVAMWVKPEAADGVIFAVGGNARGLAVYLVDGLLKYTVRISGKMHHVVTKQRVPDGWIHVGVDVRVDGTVTLLIDGKIVATGKTPHMILHMPSQALCLGSDNANPGDNPKGGFVANYNGKVHFKGTIDEFQMWVGE